MADDQNTKLFNPLSGGIDRIFRFFEMLGVTALVGVVVATYGKTVLTVVTTAGTMMAFIYLVEPMLNALTTRMVGKEANITRLSLVIIMIFAWFGMASLITPYLTTLPLRIAKTINLAG